MTNAELDALAKGLTRAQRKAIVEAKWNEPSGEWIALAMFPADRNLRAKGLTNGWRCGLTPLGLALRNHLRAQEGSAGGERS